MFLMKFSLLQLSIMSLALSLSYAGNVTGQEVLSRKISIKFENRNLRDALTDIEKAASVKFLFYSSVVPENDKLSIEFNHQRLDHVLDKILLRRKIYYEADGDQIILKPANEKASKAEEASSVQEPVVLTVSGQVLDDLGQPLPGVSVIVKGTSEGTTTDVDGRFSLEVSDEDVVLVFSFIGYQMQEVRVGEQTLLSISMQPDIATLSEVVVVGYGTQKKSDVISSISTVEAKDIVARSSANFESGLQGLAAGVSVQSQSGAPGAPVRILIRGTNSINLSTDPLYIIDGMPINVGSGGLGSSNLSPMSLINQSDIERVEILKDAAATAIYGSRGSNGVIIITTKNGKKGEGTVNLAYNTGITHLTRDPEDIGFANTAEWFRALDQAYVNDRGTPLSSNLSEYYTRVPKATIALASPRMTRDQALATDTDWYDELFQQGSFHDVNLSTSKGTENTSFYLSGNYRKDNGVQRHNDLDRVTLRSNLDFSPLKTFTISSKITFGYTRNNQRNSGITSIGVNALPWFPVRELENPTRYYNAYTEANPVAMSDPSNFLNKVEQYRGLGGVSLIYKPAYVNGLSLRSEVSADIFQSNRVVWTGGDIRTDAKSEKPESAASEEAVTFSGLNYNAYANYDKTIGDHVITAVAGVEATRSFQYIRYMYGTGLIGKYQELGTPNSLITMRAQKEYERYLLGYFGRANYKFKGRYLAGISLRRDGSSVFTPENRWGTFLAVSAGWILSEEPFMAFLGDDTFLKLRGSYGETGNQNIPPNLNVVQYNQNPVVYGSADITGVNGTIPINIAATALQWETTRSSDVGLDFGFFNNRLNGSVAYYHRFVEDMLLEAPLPFSAGVSSSMDLILGQGSYSRTSSMWGNFGDMINQGVELELFGTIYDRDGLKWTANVNIAFNRNEIQKLTDDVDKTGGGFVNVYDNAISRKGDRRAVWFIADYAGVDPATGLPMIYELDQDVYASTGETKRKKNNVGEYELIPATNQNLRSNRFYQQGKSGDPKYQGGVGSSVQYKGFDFSFLLAFSGGNYILDYDRQQTTVINPTRTLLREVYDNAWRAPGDVAKYPRLLPQLGNYSWADSYHNGFLYKADFVRLRNVQLGYSLQSSWTQRVGLRSARVYVSAANLFTSTDYPGYDPEGTGTASVPGFIYYANAIPQLRSFTAGLELKF